MRFNQELSHPSHLHILQLQDTKKLFTCDGCKEHGFGASYRCEGCNYDLHKDCARCENSLNHPFFKGQSFKFMEAPPTQDRVCDACGRDVGGFVYHCRDKGWDLHPSCAKLGCKPLTVSIDEEQVMLHLQDKVSSKCCRCGLRRAKKGVTGWSYVSTCKRFHFHVACIKDIMIEVCARLNDVNPNRGVDEVNAIINVGQELIIPSRELVPRGSGGSWSKLEKYMRIAKVVINSLISIFLGNPAGPIIELVATLLAPN